MTQADRYWVTVFAVTMGKTEELLCQGFATHRELGMHDGIEATRAALLQVIDAQVGAGNH